MGQASPFSAPPDLDHQKGRSSKTTTWIVLGLIAFCGCGGLVIMAAVLLPVFVQAKKAAIKTRSLSNIKQIGVAAALYSSDHNDRYPLAESWQDGLGAYAVQGSLSQDGGAPKPETDIFLPPYEENPGSYAFNSAMSGVKSSEVQEPFMTVLIFEAAPTGRNVHGGQEMVRRQESHFLAGFCDTSARTIPHSAIDTCLWKPK